MDLKSLFLAGLLAFSASGCVTEEPAGPAPSGTVDLNTREYPYIGYFAALRGAIFDRWTYPPEAVKENHEGAVKIEFKILKNGKVDGLKVLESSKHKELDDAIIHAIKSASPFLPLPAAFERDVITVTGTFNYVRSLFEPEQPVKGKKHRSGPKKGQQILSP